MLSTDWDALDGLGIHAQSVNGDAVVHRSRHAVV